MGKKDEDKRESERVAFYSKITLRVRDADHFMERFAGNVSETGVFIQTKDPRPVGTIVTLSTQLKTGEHLFAATSVVKWTRDSGEEQKGLMPGMGLKFLEIHPRDREWLKEVIEKNQEAEDDIEVEVSDPLAD